MEHPSSFEGRVLSDPGFSDDDGTAPELLVTALRRAAERADPSTLVEALGRTRVLVPVVATLDGVVGAASGVPQEKSADMAVVTVRAPGGRLGLPAFSSTAALAAWHPEARPVPVVGRRAALAAYDEGADALLLDLAGPVPYVVEGPALRAVAEGRLLVPPFEDPDVRAAVTAAVTASGLRPSDVRLRPGEDTDLVVTLVLHPDEDGLTERVNGLGRLLADDPVLRARLGRGLDVEVEPGVEPGRPRHHPG